MPIHPPMFVTTPIGSLGVNKCYRFLIEEYTRDKIDTWRKDDLVEKFGDSAVNTIIEEEFLDVQRQEFVQLTFNVSGTMPFRLLKHCRRLMHDFVLLQLKLDAVKRCSSGKLRDCVSYLINFGLIDLINLPGSTTPFVMAVPEFEDGINSIYKVSEFLDFPYIEPQEEELREHKRLMQLESIMNNNY